MIRHVMEHARGLRCPKVEKVGKNNKHTIRRPLDTCHVAIRPPPRSRPSLLPEHNLTRQTGAPPRHDTNRPHNSTRCTRHPPTYANNYRTFYYSHFILFPNFIFQKMTRLLLELLIIKSHIYLII